MKPNHLFTSLLAVTALFVASCSTPRMAQNAVQDDVYNTTAQAKEYKPSVPMQNTQVDNSVNEDYYGKTDPSYDMDYSSRIDRFYYGNQYRNYYDPYYNYYGYNSYYSPYGYNNYYLPNTFGYSIGAAYNFYNNWYSPYFGYPYNNYWGIYSYNPYGGGYYGGGYYGGGYYGGGYYAGRNTNNPNYGARPNRGSENGVGANGTYTGRGSSFGTPSRGNNNNNTGLTRSRSEMYNPNNGNVGRAPGSSNSPSRTEQSSSRPTRSSEAPSRQQPTYNPPPQQSSPPPSSGGRSQGSSGGSSGGGGRPTRGGGR